MFYVLCVAFVAWQCFMVALDTQLGGLGQLFHNWHVVAISLANALLLLSPYWLLRRRWRWLVGPVTRRLFARIAAGKRGSARIARLLY